MSDGAKVELSGGGPVTADHREINPATGMQKGYVVLSPEERAKGFVRPLRRSYVHRGARPRYPTRELTPEEVTRFAGFDYVRFEPYPEGKNDSVVGRYWTAAQLRSGCGAVTTMAQDIAETYARDPAFYGGTFCAGCRTHRPLEEFVWEGTDDVVGS